MSTRLANPFIPAAKEILLDSGFKPVHSTTVASQAVVAFVESLTDIFVELKWPEICEPLKEVDGLLAEIDACDTWRSAGIHTEARLEQLTEKFLDIAQRTAERNQPAQQLQLAVV